MLLVAMLAFGLAASAMTALLLVVVSRLLLGAPLTFGSAFKAAFLVFVVLWLVQLALLLAGPGRVRVLTSPTGSVLVSLGSVVLLIAFLAWLRKTTDGQPITLRQVVIAVVLVSVVEFAIGWLLWRAYWPSALQPQRTGNSEPGFELPALSQVCLRNLARMLSDTGSGPRPGAAEEFKQRLEAEARARSITMEEALKQELRKLGARPPGGCDHLK